jgi:hypothetical protein
MKTNSELTTIDFICIEPTPLSIRVASGALHEDVLLYRNFKDNWLRMHKD